MIKRLFSILSCIIFSVFIMSCSLLSPRGYCDVQFQVPARTGTTNTDNVEIWHVVVTDSKTGKEIHKASYHPGEIVTLNEVFSGKYDIKVFGSNGEALYSKVTNTNVKPGTVNNVDVKLEKKVDIRTGLTNLGTIKNVTGPDNINSFTASGDDNNYYVSRLYSFSNFKQEFLALFNAVENNDNEFVQVGEYSKHNPEDLAIEVTAEIDRTTLEIKQYILAIKNNLASENERFKIYIEYMQPPYFENLTTNFTKSIKIKNALDNYIDTIDASMKSLGTATTPDIRAHETLLPYSWQDDYMYYTRLYVFDDFIPQIKNQLKDKVGNCGFHFNSIYDDPITKPLIQLGIDVVPSNFNSSNPQESFTYNLRFKSTEISKNNDLDGYGIYFYNTENFDKFLTMADHPFYPPNGISFTLQKNAITGLTEDSNNPEAMQFNAIVREKASNKVITSEKITLNSPTIINIPNGTYFIDIVGSDKENVFIGAPVEATVQNDITPITPPTFKKFDTQARTKLSKFGNISSIRSGLNGYGIEINFDDKGVPTYTISKLYIFDSFNSDFNKLLEGKIQDSEIYRDYGLSSDDLQKHIIELSIQIGNNNNVPASLSVNNYILGIHTPDSNKKCHKDYINSEAFDKLAEKLNTISIKLPEIKETFTNTYDEKIKTLGEFKYLKDHESITFHRYSNLYFYTKFYVFTKGSLNATFTGSLKEQNPNGYKHFGMSQEELKTLDYIEVNVCLDDNFNPTNYELFIRFEGMKSPLPGEDWLAVCPNISPDRWNELISKPDSFAFNESELPK